MDDPRVDVYRNVRDADMRGRDGLFMAESELVIRRLLRTPDRIHSMLLSPEKYARLRPALQDLPEKAAIYVTELKLMHDIAAFHIHRGVLAAGFRPQPDELSLDAALGHLRDDLAEHPTILIAQGITNVDNMGALFRNAAAFGVNGVLLDATCCDPLYRKAIRVSMGHALSIPYAVSENWQVDLDRLKTEWQIMLIGAETTERAIPLWQMPKADRIGVVFGSEGHGLPQETIEKCHAICQIPMACDVPSINVAVASAVFLYELQRQRQGSDGEP